VASFAQAASPQAAPPWSLQLPLCGPLPVWWRHGRPLRFAAGCTDNPATLQRKICRINDARQNDRGSARSKERDGFEEGADLKFAGAGNVRSSVGPQIGFIFPVGDMLGYK
jgi:hypothetical protein